MKNLIAIIFLPLLVLPVLFNDDGEGRFARAALVAWIILALVLTSFGFNIYHAIGG